MCIVFLYNFFCSESNKTQNKSKAENKTPALQIVKNENDNEVNIIRNISASSFRSFSSQREDIPVQIDAIVWQDVTLIDSNEDLPSYNQKSGSKCEC